MEKISQIEQVITKEEENWKKISQLEQVISENKLFNDLRECIENPRKKCQEIVDQINSGNNNSLEFQEFPHICSIIIHC